MQTGERIERYELRELLGEGGMGRVYRALDTKLRRPVALKLLRPEKRGDGDAGAARLLREARAAAALRHANAVAIYDVGEADGAAYIAMELVEGRSLRSYIGDKEVPLATRVRWLVEVARALDAAHQAGLVHRDVKPENVMIAADGAVKVLDFGIARLAPSDAAVPSSAQGVPSSGRGAIPGTPRYMSPEQINGEPLDGRADQFAWGVMAYELVTGLAPWAGDTTSFSLVLEILSEEPKADAMASAGAPAAVMRAILRAMSKAPSDRFASMVEIVQALEPHTRENAAAAVPAAPARTNALLRWAAVAAAAIGVGAFALFELQRAPRVDAAARSETTTAPSPPPSLAPAPEPAPPPASASASASTSAPASTGAASAPSSPPARRPTGGKTAFMSMGITNDVVDVGHFRDVVAARGGAINACYAAVEFDPVDHRFMGWTLTVNASGAVVGVTPEGPPRCAALDACMARALGGLAFGPADMKKGTTMTVRFTSRPKGG